MPKFSILVIIANIQFSLVFTREENHYVSGRNQIQKEPNLDEEIRKFSRQQLDFHEFGTYKSNVSEKAFDEPQKHNLYPMTHSSENASKEVTFFCALIFSNYLDFMSRN